MHAFKKLALFVSALLPFASALPQSANNPTTPPVEATQPLPNQYIVTLKETVSDVQSHLNWVDGIHARNLGRRELGLAGMKETYNITKFKGYTGAFDDATIAQIKANPQVEAVEQDETWFTYARPTTRVITQESLRSWGLAAISSKSGGKTKVNAYAYEDTAGAGTYAYVIDTGINEKHVEFGKRIVKTHNIFDTKGPKKGSTNDKQGHGTHIAGIIAGQTFGVAKEANIVAVKVVKELREFLFFGEYVTTKSLALVGYQWAIKDIIANKRQGKSVINVSMGTAYASAEKARTAKDSPSWEKAVADAWKSDIFTVVAAGNHNINVSRVVPANVPGAFSVGATDKDNYIYGWSNWGETVDILAPGVAINSAYIGSPTANITWDGTSQAAPHVAGLALNLMAMGINKPAAIEKRIKELSTKDLIKGINQRKREGTPNRFLYNNAGKR